MEAWGVGMGHRLRSTAVRLTRQTASEKRTNHTKPRPKQHQHHLHGRILGPGISCPGPSRCLSLFLCWRHC
jgi:hypothetical protein